MRRKLVGRMNVAGAIDITDPCYDRDVWCRINGIKIRPGEYDCNIWDYSEKYEYEGETHTSHVVGVIGLYFEGMIPNQSSMENIGEIGVDAGLAGFFVNKPDFSDEAWDTFLKITENGRAWVSEIGFFSSSGYGDGMYPVYVQRDVDGEIIAVEIRFV